MSLAGWAAAGEETAGAIAVYPVRAEGFTQSLNGDWSFKYIPVLEAGADTDFHAPAFDVTAWKTVRVPANWELQGFAEPRYAEKLADGLGLYRRMFRLPDAWRGGRRVCLRFEGVAFGFQAWVNGRSVGVSGASAYNPNTFDITDALQTEPGADKTEYAHALGPATDRIQDQGEIIQETPQFAGGAIWHFRDTGTSEAFRPFYHSYDQ